jgi:hypothetical protein
MRRERRETGLEELRNRGEFIVEISSLINVSRLGDFRETTTRAEIADRNGGL